MEIKINLKEEEKESIKLIAMQIYKARHKRNNKIILVIPGFHECHYIKSGGEIQWTSDYKYLIENYEILEKVNLKW